MPITEEEVKGCISAGLTGTARRDFCALECLANELPYAKPDSQKMFLLWEAKIPPGDTRLRFEDRQIQIDSISDLKQKHPWVYNLFIPPDVVRFPFNVQDANIAHSLSWQTIAPDLRAPDFEIRLLKLPRWSTASRSCLALIPKDTAMLEAWGFFDFRHVETLGKRDPTKVITRAAPNGETIFVNSAEWLKHTEGRFFEIIRDVGWATKEADTPPTLDSSRRTYRLYSIKTGVDYIGSVDEGLHHKNLLGLETALAMSRSQAIAAMHNRDMTFGVQTEVLTVTALTTMTDEDDHPLRDGFQVRDLSCLQPGLHYIPGQAIPHARAAFDEKGPEDTQGQLEFWRKNFAVPLGRAKARLFLNYGLIHLSANAQNFLLGFKGSKLEQFVVRDVGDTSWHDKYLTTYFPAKHTVRQIFSEEQRRQPDDRHPRPPVGRPPGPRDEYLLLESNSDDSYGPPGMVRLAVDSVISHGFAETLSQAHHWSWAQIYEFTTGMLDGFRGFFLEVFPHMTLPRDAIRSEATDEEIKTNAGPGRYPSPATGGLRTNYEALVRRLLLKSEAELFGRANRARELGGLIGPAGQKPEMLKFLNAEELYLCAGFEVLLRKAEEASKAQIDKYLKSGAWPAIVK